MPKPGGNPADRPNRNPREATRLYINGNFAGEVSLNAELADQVPTPEFPDLLRSGAKTFSHLSKNL